MLIIILVILNYKIERFDQMQTRKQLNQSKKKNQFQAILISCIIFGIIVSIVSGVVILL